ncbi:MAG: phosphatidylinositol-specific phospholipase C1-like protein [Planctomycetes bacterium]|nr:phosphatidylinositol-specific phospholipase C1-like protein [Planctomycetota bacterium]
MIAALLLACAAQGDLDELQLNQLQFRGTHNSYHQRPALVLHKSHDYSHPSLTEQLSLHGIRQFELDVHLSKEGSFEVFHLQKIDPRTSCATLRACLEECLAWSVAHPRHLPLLFWLELKDDEDWEGSPYVSMSGRHAELERLVLGAWPKDRIITPDEVRGEHPSLPEAIASDGWPKLGALRGRAMFALLERDTHRAEYLSASPKLRGRPFFVASRDPADPSAAIYKIDSALSQGPLIRRLVAAGFLVGSNCDKAGASDEQNTNRLRATLAAGSHFLSSDFAVAKAGAGYTFDLGGHLVRCNPVTAPLDCVDLELPPLRVSPSGDEVRPPKDSKREESQ